MVSFTGNVIKGIQRGRGLGYPTANVPLQQEVPEGIYASEVEVNGLQHQGLTFIGAAKTFDETVYQSETYILDFDGDIYGQELKVVLLKKIRGNQKFTTIEALIEQMKQDEREAREYFLKSL